MKKLQLLVFLLFVSASAFALNANEEPVTHYLGVSTGYSHYTYTSDGNDAYYLYGQNITIKVEDSIKGSDNLSFVTYLTYLFPTIEVSGVGNMSSFFDTTFIQDLSTGLTFSRILSDKTSMYSNFGLNLNMVLLSNDYASSLTYDLGLFAGSGIKTLLGDDLFLDLSCKVNYDFIEYYFTNSSYGSDSGTTEDFYAFGVSANVGLTYIL